VEQTSLLRGVAAPLFTGRRRAALCSGVGGSATCASPWTLSVPYRPFTARAQAATSIGNHNPLLHAYTEGKCLSHRLSSASLRFRGYQGSICGRSKLLLSSSQGPDWIRGPLTLLFNGVSRTISLEIKRSGSEADHSHPSTAEDKNAWSYTSTLPARLYYAVLN
jgi:hypothetical protein